jgi:hypothetical protein
MDRNLRADVRRGKINRVSETGDLYEDITLLCHIAVVTVFWLPNSMQLFNLSYKEFRAATQSQESNPAPYLATVVSLRQSCDLETDLAGASLISIRNLSHHSTVLSLVKSRRISVDKVITT